MELSGKILVVDDEPINLEFFDVMLSKLGFEIAKAVDGEDALVKVEEFEPDLIVLDNIMPGLSGWEVTKLLKQDDEYSRFRDVPIIMFSAMDNVKDKIEGFELGIDDYITKPFNFSEVLARIRAVLRNRELMKQIAQRERRLSIIESLNKSLLYFTRHIRGPVSELIKTSEKTDINKEDDVKLLLTVVKKESAEMLASIEGLEEEILELQKKGDTIKQDDLSLDEMERKLEKHLKEWKDIDTKLEGVER